MTLESEDHRGESVLSKSNSNSSTSISSLKKQPNQISLLTSTENYRNNLQNHFGQKNGKISLNNNAKPNDATMNLNNNNHNSYRNNNNNNDNHKSNNDDEKDYDQMNEKKPEIIVHLDFNNDSENIDYDKKRGRITIFGYRPSQIKWTNVIWLLFTHTLAVFAYVYVSLYPVKLFTIPWIVFLGVAGGFGVSIGAHRLWAHRSFKARWPLRAGLVLAETLSMNGGCYSYARDHRCHHKFVDTNGDPKNAKRGFFFAHIGWWMLKKHPDVFRMGKKLNHKDLDDEPLITWQKKLYVPLFILISIVMPTLVPYYVWNEDLIISFFMSAVLRTVVVVHHLFTVNSIAHIWGLRPYNRDIGPTESKLTMYLSLGEGSHNYHHTFPMDYANCEKKWWEVFNPSTLFVDICALLGLAYDLRKPSEKVIQGVVRRIGDQKFYETKLIVHRSLRHRIMHGINDWLIGTIVAGWALYPPILFKLVTGRPLIVF